MKLCRLNSCRLKLLSVELFSLKILRVELVKFELFMVLFRVELLDLASVARKEGRKLPNTGE